MDTATQTEPEARSNSDRAFVFYQRLVGLFLPIMVAATYPIWIPQTSFPAVPAFEFLCSVPGIVDSVLFLLILILPLVIELVGPQAKGTTWLWLAVTFVLGLTFLLNQHRFQPWAYQFAVISLLFGLAPPPLAKRLASWLALSIYFYSALSKLNPAFVNELGIDFLVTFSSLARVTLDPSQVQSWKWLAFAFPAFEMLAFLLLLVPRTRKAGVVAACLMHGGLLLVLGPMGMNHSWGVLLWNLFFIAQAILLFWYLPAAVPSMPGTWQVRSAQLVCWLVILFPTLEIVGLGDPWPAWGLYASHVGRTHCFIVRSGIESLPEDLQAYVEAPSGEDLFIPVDLDRWSIESTGAPIYPGERFAYAVGRALVTKTGTQELVLFVRESPSGRFVDERQAVRFPAKEMGQARASQFWFNTRPRSYFLRD